MKQKVKANIPKVRHILGLIEYYKKCFPILSDIISPLNELTKKNTPFKCTEECQKSLDCINQIITSSPISAYPDPDKKYYLFTDSSKHSLSGVLVQYHEQKQEDGTTLNILHLIINQSGTVQGPEKVEHAD